MSNFEAVEQHAHYLLFKPYGYLSQFISNGRLKQKHKYLGELYNFAPGTMSIGRLDLQSEGLLLLTTDGQVSFEITSHKYEKEYYVQLDGEINQNAMDALGAGVEISINGKNYQTLPAKVKKIDPPVLPKRAKPIRSEAHGPTSWISITIREGKFRQVRKMTAAVGFPTLRLVRYRIGSFTIEGMQAGDVIELEQI